MKKLNVFLLSVFAVISFCSPIISNAQIQKGVNYYYNNFDSQELGINISNTSVNASLELSAISPLAGTHSLSSIGDGKAGSYRFSFIDNGFDMNIDAEKNGWEWTFLYKNSGGNTDNSVTIDDHTNSWRYWLYANDDNLADMKGYFLTQIGSTMHLYIRNGQNDVRSVISYDLSSLGGNDITYAVRVQRIHSNGYAFRIFIDPYASSKTEATTLRVQSNSGDFNSYKNYNYSGLQLSSTNAGRFKFDELKMYARKIEISAASGPENGISAPLYNGQKDAVIYALRFKTRGLFDDIYQLQLAVNMDIGQYGFGDVVENPRLYRSTDDYFGNEDDLLINKSKWNGFFAPSVGYRVLTASDFEPPVFHSVGTADGQLANAGALFFKVDIKPEASGKGPFSIDKLERIGNYSDNIDYVKQVGTVQGSTATTPSAAANVFDWIGGSDVWAALSNWQYPNGSEPTVLPGSSDLVRIGVRTGFSQSPIISTDVEVAAIIIGGTSGTNPSIHITDGKTLTVATSFSNERQSEILGNGNLEIKGNWSTFGGNINLNPQHIVLKFTGAKAQLITNKSLGNSNDVLFGNVFFSGEGKKTLSGGGKFAVEVGKYLTIGDHTILETSGLLILKSSSLGSASVGAIPVNSSIRGSVRVERFVQGGDKAMYRTYRMWSSPVYDNQSDFTNADNVGGRSFTFAQFIDDIIITGKDGANNGFDLNAANTTSAWTYDNGFVEIPSINTAVDAGRGAYLVYRGDRSNYEAKVNSPYVDPESTVITYNGSLNQQDVTVPLVHGSKGFSMLGNPYAATLDWKAITKTANVGDVIRIWNPQYKQYASYNGEFGVNGGARYIGPGQAFFVQTTDNNSPSVTFKETAKVGSSSQSAQLYNKVMSAKEDNLVKVLNSATSVGHDTEVLNDVPDQPSLIRMTLSREGVDNSDETLIVLKSNELATVAGKDVTKMTGEIVFLSSLSQENRKMAINYMPHISELNDVKLSVTADSTGTYTLATTANHIPFGYQAKLKDKFLNKLVDLETQGTIYSFNIDKSQKDTYGDHRFEILFSPVKTLPVELIEFKGVKTNQGVLLSWKTALEQNNNHFEIRRAGEEQIFTPIGTVKANQDGVYTLLDTSPLAGNNYYKLIQVDNDGEINFHDKLVVVKHQLNENVVSQLTVYPTIVENNFTLKFNGTLTTKNMLVKISDLTGKEVFHSKVTEAEIFDGYKANMPSTGSGVYMVTLQDLVNGRQIGTTKLIKR